MSGSFHIFDPDSAIRAGDGIELSIQATPMNNLVLLTGTVANPDDAAEATRLTQAYVGDGTQVAIHHPQM